MAFKGFTVLSLPYYRAYYPGQPRHDHSQLESPPKAPSHPSRLLLFSARGFAVWPPFSTAERSLYGLWKSLKTGFKDFTGRRSFKPTGASPDNGLDKQDRQQAVSVCSKLRRFKTKFENKGEKKDTATKEDTENCRSWGPISGLKPRRPSAAHSSAFELNSGFGFDVYHRFRQSYSALKAYNEYKRIQPQLKARSRNIRRERMEREKMKKAIQMEIDELVRSIVKGDVPGTEQETRISTGTRVSAGEDQERRARARRTGRRIPPPLRSRYADWDIAGYMRDLDEYMGFELEHDNKEEDEATRSRRGPTEMGGIIELAKGNHLDWLD